MKTMRVAQLLTGILLITTRFALAQQGGSPIYFEAEWAHSVEMNYQIERDQIRTYLISDEGSDGAFAWNRRTHVSLDVGEAHYTVDVPKEGNYVLWAMRYWMDACGNSAHVSIADEPFETCMNIGGSQRELFGKWLWGEFAPDRHYAAGQVSIKVRVCEDGPRFDAFALLPAGQTPNEKDLQKATPHFFDTPAIPYTGSVSLPTQVIASNNTLAVNVYVRRMLADTLKGEVSVILPDHLKGADVPSQPFEFKKDEIVKRISFKVQLSETVSMGEHKMKVAVKDQDGKECSIKTFVVLKPLDWRILGPLPHRSHTIDPIAFSKSPNVKDWKHFPLKAYDRFTTMDLELALGECLGRSAYLYTEIHSEEDQDVSMLVNNDDQVWIWVNGKSAYQDLSQSPAIGGQIAVKVALKKGDNRILVRINQSTYVTARRENYWRLRLRFRTPDNIRRFAPVRGLIIKPE